MTYRYHDRDHKFMEDLYDEVKLAETQADPVYAEGRGIAYFSEPGVLAEVRESIKSSGVDPLVEHSVRQKLAALRKDPAELVHDFIRGIKGSV